MTDIVSYAQNGEDLVLWGALGNIGQGFYIDVGAADPVKDSVTKLFYDRGWSGINAEPRPRGFQSLLAARPRDLNLQVAVSDHSGSITLHEISPFIELSTSDADLAADYLAQGMTCQAYEVPCRTLSDICNEYVRGEIHFLKIDVEGAETSTLRSGNFSRFRPWLLAIEATWPCTDIPSHEEWEPFVLSAGYDFALFHHVNRYYVAQEHSYLLTSVKNPTWA